MAMSDKFLALGIMNAKTVGLVLFSSVYLFAVLRQIFTNGNFVIPGLTRNPVFNSKKDGSRLVGRDDIIRPDLQPFLESLILVNAAFFLFQTQSHDRYAFPLIVFLLLWAPFVIQFGNLSLRAKRSNLYNYEIATSSRLSGTPRNDNKSKIFAIFYLLFTLFYFYNLHTALIINYPHNGIPGLSLLTQPFFTITTSVVLLGLFGIFLLYIGKHTKSIVSVVAVAVPMTILFAGNISLILKKPVSLTKLTPYVSEQGYGKRTINMPVNAFLGYPKQSYLSVQYAFYRTGIGTHSPSFMNYDIGGHFKKFTTDYGIDTEAGGKGTAIFEIFGDDTLLFTSEKIGRYDNPRHAEVDVTGVKKLGLVTTDAGDGKDDDHTDWLQPTLWP